MSIRNLLVGSHIVETSENYSRADDPLTAATGTAPSAEPAASTHPDYLDDGYFWQEVIDSKTGNFRKEYNLDQITVSEWVARVPGLGWSPQAIEYRNRVEHVERMIGGYAYEPPVKSAHVISGVGTLRLAPADDGTTLVSVCRWQDASLGVPALMSAEVFDKVQKDGGVEGRVISGKARWMPMSATWASNFPNLTSIPRGYLVLNKPDDITVHEHTSSTQIYPFTVLEYEDENRSLFDYVYAGAQTDEPEHRGALEKFFVKYLQDLKRQGEYLFNGDMVKPLWDATYNSPSDLRNEVGAQSKLNLLEARVREQMLGKHDLDELLNRMGASLSEEDLRVVSDEIGIPSAVWFAGGATVADLCSALLDAARQRNRLEALIQSLASRAPGMF
jgi:hypothetical protein